MKPSSSSLTSHEVCPQFAKLTTRAYCLTLQPVLELPRRERSTGSIRRCGWHAFSKVVAQPRPRCPIERHRIGWGRPLTAEEWLPVFVEVRKRRRYVDRLHLDSFQSGAREKLLERQRVAQRGTNSLVQLRSLRPGDLTTRETGARPGGSIALHTARKDFRVPRCRRPVCRSHRSQESVGRPGILIKPERIELKVPEQSNE